MKTSTYTLGLPSFRLILLAGCTSAPPSPEPTLIVSGYPALVPCTLPGTSTRSNGDQLTDQDRVQAAWAACASQVGMVYQHQQARP